MENSTEEGYGDYYSYNFTDDETYLLETEIKLESAVVPVLLTAAVLFSLVGNLLVLVILGHYKTFKSLTNIFLLNLAVSDLVFTLGLPFWACYHIWGWTFGDVMCKGVMFVFSAGFYSSTVFLMLMSVQCYVVVVHPLSDWNGRQRVLFPVFAWVVSFAAALPAALFSEVLAAPLDPNKLYCEYRSFKATVGVTYEQNTFFVVAFLVGSFCFIRILQTIIKSQTKKTVRLIFCIVVVFFVSWAPYNIVIFVQTFTFYQAIDYSVFTQLVYAHYICQLLAYTHCCLNPVIYILACTNARNQLRALLQKIFHQQTHTEFHQEEIQSESFM